MVSLSIGGARNEDGSRSGDYGQLVRRSGYSSMEDAMKVFPTLLSLVLAGAVFAAMPAGANQAAVEKNKSTGCGKTDEMAGPRRQDLCGPVAGGHPQRQSRPVRAFARRNGPKGESPGNRTRSRKG